VELVVKGGRWYHEYQHKRVMEVFEPMTYSYILAEKFLYKLVVIYSEIDAKTPAANQRQYL
jgi:hypothetical protein